ncbi:histone deacetylase family protein [Pikeienuella sp. HZG-20]|uniref:histone deacetylase family protein n=1 Tax=Paludibacillus litoralis TaxID=3133267 RepID=UPI0030EC3E9D
MTFAILSHPDSLRHLAPPGHPERVARIEAVSAALAAPEFAAALRVEAPLAGDAAILRAHSAAHLRRLEAAAPAAGFAALDGDTSLSPGSLDAARRAAGANVKAVDMVLGGEVSSAFCAVRPPGHHAERETAMGFCFFSNAAIGALHALEAHGLSRVAIADFDVHHGNGTQDVVQADSRIFFASSHQSPLYPGTGMEDETGVGNVLNATLAPRSDGAAFRKAWEERLLPAIDAHAPELLIISAGFDAHRRDPLAELTLDEADFVWITEKLADLAARRCAGRLVSTLEGGYDLDALAASVAGHAKVLMERAS